MFATLQTIDFRILDAIRSSCKCALLDHVMPVISALGNYGILWIAIALLFLLWKKKRACGTALAIGLIASVVLGNAVLKNVFGRPRPCWINTGVELLIKNPTDYSFPSGHTLAATIAAVILFRDDRRIGIPALILAGLIAFSRLYLYVHFPSDVLASIVLGILIAAASIRLAATLRRKLSSSF